jgi:hypothetical protein
MDGSGTGGGSGAGAAAGAAGQAGSGRAGGTTGTDASASGWLLGCRETPGLCELSGTYHYTCYPNAATGLNLPPDCDASGESGPNAAYYCCMNQYVPGSSDSGPWLSGCQPGAGQCDGGGTYYYSCQQTGATLKVPADCRSTAVNDASGDSYCCDNSYVPGH